MLSNVVRVTTDGTMHNVLIDQRHVHLHLPGGATFVGAIHELLCFAVGAANPNESDGENQHTLGEFVEKGVRGDFYLVGSDDKGEPQDIDVDTISAFLRPSKGVHASALAPTM
tara:strand:+ start:5489 stop:5827 length:339 start_codon:yes stop_codon:yes gene_type:complete